jgi:2-keto-myo-inositol isomerase
VGCYCRAGQSARRTGTTSGAGSTCSASWRCRSWSSPPTSSARSPPTSSAGPETHPSREPKPRASASLREAAELARPFGVRLALEFQKGASICASLDTTLALIAQHGVEGLGVCFDLFHYYTGPSKFEDLAYLTRDNLAWVQVCDLSGTPRELAGDGDRILPGEGDFQIGPILDHLGRIGYDGYVSLEVLNPRLWRVPVDRVADLGYQALCRVLGHWNQAGSWGGA